MQKSVCLQLCEIDERLQRESNLDTGNGPDQKDASRRASLEAARALAADGYYALQTADTGDVPVRLFLTAELLTLAEDTLYRQIVNATRFPGVKLVVITPDVHYGYGVPVGCVLITDYESGAMAMGPVGYDIGCGMMSAKSNVPADAATPEKRLQFNRAVMERVAMGAGGKSIASEIFPSRIHRPRPRRRRILRREVRRDFRSQPR